MEWNQAEFEKACERFRMRYPDFKSFEVPGDQYLQEERDYKIELIGLYKQRVQPHALGHADDFICRYIEILETKLDSSGDTQNLIDPFTRAALKRLQGEERKQFGRLLQGVLRYSQTTEGVASSLEEYTEGASIVRTSHDESLSPSTIRACVSLLLMLDKPDRFIYLTFSYWRESGEMLVNNQLIDWGALISREEFLRCNEFIARVRLALNDAGFRPKDMVDVQSFLYVIVHPAWDQSNFEAECQRFKNRYEGFVDFKSSGDFYVDNVRKFKDELVEIYNRELIPLLDKNGAEFIRKYHDITKRKLDAYRPKKNEEGLNLHLIDEIPDNKKEEFGKLLQNLLREVVSDDDLVSDKKLSKAFDHYGRESSNLLGNEDRMPSVARVHATLLLMLAQPEHFMHAVYVVWNATGKSLRGEPLIKPNAVVDGGIVLSCQELAKGVRKALEEEGFRPRDMIDVQSFLWSIYKPDEKPRGSGEMSRPSISEILKHIQAEGMRIDEVTLKRYITSLDTRGFLILAGPSGTGKTWLTRLYATAIRAKHQLVPVAPNWAANEDLLGYFNPMEGKFHATTFLEFVDQAAEHWDKHGSNAQEFHLVLDEMNLARIEHYFSLFLSLMEMRRGNNVPETHLSGGRRVRVPPNLKFIGTVNIDETTHGFADKVFDRAQLLELSIDFKSAKQHIEDRLDNRACTAVLLDLWKAMEPAHPVGFRVLDDIADYIERSEKDSTHWKAALDQQIVSKLLPKLRGVDPEVAEALRNVRKLVDEDFPLARDKSEIMWRRYEATDVVSYF